MLNAPLLTARQHEILVVDDSQLSLEVMSRILTDHGYRVRTAPTGQIALLSVANKPPDPILLDVTMPEMDGLEVCRSLKSKYSDQILERGSEFILFIEDEPALIELGKTMLTSLGYLIITAATPEEALLIAAQEKNALQLLITDVVMPGMNGIDLANRLRAQSRGLKCIFMSGYTPDVTNINGIDKESVQFIQKPLEFSSLAKKVHEVLDS